jgi:Amt family ammonium transporter
MAFGPDAGGFVGNLDWMFLKGVGTKPGPYASTIPYLLFCAFQLMFAIITPALITGAFAERVQTVGAGAAIIYSLVLTFIILKIVNKVAGLRVSEEEEQQGLDITQHSEIGYSL